MASNKSHVMAGLAALFLLGCGSLQVARDVQLGARVLLLYFFVVIRREVGANLSEALSTLQRLRVFG